jgi:hypothetical protein
MAEAFLAPIGCEGHRKGKEPANGCGAARSGAGTYAVSVCGSRFKIAQDEVNVKRTTKLAAVASLFMPFVV